MNLVFAEVFQNRRPELVLSADGKLSGSTGCNRLTGQFTVQGHSFRVQDPVGMTKMACPGYDETVYLGALRKVNRFSRRGKELLLFQDDRVIMGFTRTE